MSNRLKDAFDNAGNALERLREALALVDVNDITRDGTIQRFEFCIELMWKLFFKLLQEQQLDVQPLPKTIMQKAYSIGWIADEKIWLQMLEDRNQTSHTYKQKLAQEIFERIKTYYPAMQESFDQIQRKYR